MLYTASHFTRKGVAHMAKPPKECEGCRYLTWYRRNAECFVFTEFLPKGWRKPDGSCQAYRPEKEDVIVIEVSKK